LNIGFDMKMNRDKHPNLTLLKRSAQPYPDSPDKARLEAFENAYPKRRYRIHFDCPEFTSLCPVTGQPDFGHITIDYVPGKLCLESKSLKLYLFSFRNHPTFHEEAVNRILDDVAKAIRPREATVKGVFNPRGGIAITVEAKHPAVRRQEAGVGDV
jgi:7-cyano-7-deazaguanine reductase